MTVSEFRFRFSDHATPVRPRYQENTAWVVRVRRTLSRALSYYKVRQFAQGMGRKPSLAAEYRGIVGAQWRRYGWRQSCQTNIIHNCRFFFATPTLTSPYYVTLGTFEMIEIYSIKANVDYFFLLSVRR